MLSVSFSLHIFLQTIFNDTSFIHTIGTLCFSGQVSAKNYELVFNTRVRPGLTTTLKFDDENMFHVRNNSNVWINVLKDQNHLSKIYIHMKTIGRIHYN